MESSKKKSMLIVGGCLVLLLMVICGSVVAGTFFFLRNLPEEMTSDSRDDYTYDYNYDSTDTDTYNDPLITDIEFSPEYEACHDDAYNKYIAAWDKECAKVDPTTIEYGDDGICLLDSEIAETLDAVFDAESVSCDVKYPEDSTLYDETYGVE